MANSPRSEPKPDQKLYHWLPDDGMCVPVKFRIQCQTLIVGKGIAPPATKGGSVRIQRLRESPALEETDGLLFGAALGRKHVPNSHPTGVAANRGTGKEEYQGGLAAGASCLAPDRAAQVPALSVGQQKSASGLLFPSQVDNGGRSS